jgi:hypothetical protein
MWIFHIAPGSGRCRVLRPWQPGKGCGQFAHPNIMTALLYVEREWQAVDDRQLGIATSAWLKNHDNYFHLEMRTWDEKTMDSGIGAINVFSVAYAGGQSGWGEYRPLKGSYLVYSNALSEQEPPTPQDRNISFIVTGAVAKDMFNSMAPHSKERCSSAKDYRERNKENILCTLNKDGYACHFGFNLRSGKSIAGAIC